ncbi:MAG: hypothetical protein WBX01_17165 [Nitrososphaeraceae archaeon]
MSFKDTCCTKLRCTNTKLTVITISISLFYLCSRTSRKHTATGISLPTELFERIEEDRGDTSRSKFLQRIIKKAYKKQSHTDEITTHDLLPRTDLFMEERQRTQQQENEI